ncbi:DUF3040 domain-containing protein [Nonomuraea sp. NPDC050556]|uniref:DUF3040 domain-containing protein n=1 Tax=Nonomuraea sp. NPDC050556 TaxID=3364369 RepID=UPI00378C239A
MEGLTRQERRSWARIEKRLVREDPAFARRVTVLVGLAPHPALRRRPSDDFIAWITKRHVAGLLLAVMALVLLLLAWP